MSLQERTPVPILQHDAEFETLLKLYRALKPERVLEVGTYHGGTLYHWLNSAEPNWDDAESPIWPTIVSVDSYAVGVDNRDLYPDWIPKGSDGTPKRFSLQVIQGDSRDEGIVAYVRAYGRFDWIFIDAGHFYHEVQADWENYSPMAAEGGVICLHDILEHPAHPEIEVKRLWDEIKAEHHTFEIVADPFAEWGGIGVVLL